MLPRVRNLLPRSCDNSESTDYFPLEFTTSISTPTCVSSSLYSNQIDHQVLDIILNLGNPKYVWRQRPLDLTKDSHTQHKEQPQNVARVFPFILKAKYKTLHVKWVWAELENFAEKTICTSFDWSSLILNRSSQTNLHSKSCSTLDSNCTHKHTLSKSKTRLKRFDHGLLILQNEVLIHLNLKS